MEGLLGVNFGSAPARHGIRSVVEEGLRIQRLLANQMFLSLWSIVISPLVPSLLPLLVSLHTMGGYWRVFPSWNKEMKVGDSEASGTQSE